jgi:hypothetical protein
MSHFASSSYQQPKSSRSSHGNANILPGKDHRNEEKTDEWKNMSATAWIPKKKKKSRWI